MNGHGAGRVQVKDIDLVRGVHRVERPARADRDTDRAERGRCFDTHGQVFPLDEHRGQGRYPTYTLKSNTDTTCRQNVVADQMLHIYQVNALFNFCLFYIIY